MRTALKSTKKGWACLILLLGVASARGDALLGKIIEVELPAQQATTALIQFSTLVGVQIIMQGHLLDSVNAPELHGRMSIGSALDRILQATPHSIQITQGNTVTVIVPPVAARVR